MIYFITSNDHKFAEGKAIIPSLQRLDLELPEVQELDPHKILASKIRAAQNQHDGDFVVEDVSLRLACLAGFPGPLYKWLHAALSGSGVADLVHRYDDHTAVASVILAYAPRGKAISYFEGNINGTIVQPRGSSAFGFDNIFLPDGCSKTYGEMTPEEKNNISHRGIAFRKLKEFLN